MPTCALTQGYNPKSCKQPGGVKAFLITDFANVTGITKTAGVVSAITKASGTKFWKYSFRPELANWKQTPAADDKSGTYAYDIEANMQLNGLDQVSSDELHLMLKSTTMIISQDNDGTYWLLGEDYGLVFASGSKESGNAMSDFRGDKVQFKGRQFTPVCTVDSTIIAALLT